MTTSEKRRYPRVSLKVDDGYFGNFILPDNSKLMASIVNLSGGGVNFSVTPQAVELLKAGDVLLLKHIAGAAQLSFLEDIKAEICWIKVLEDPGMVSVGCGFLAIAPPVQEQLSRFIDAERTVRGQYD